VETLSSSSPPPSSSSSIAGAPPQPSHPVATIEVGTRSADWADNEEVVFAENCYDHLRSDQSISLSKAPPSMDHAPEFYTPRGDTNQLQTPNSEVVPLESLVTESPYNNFPLVVDNMTFDPDEFLNFIME